MVQVTARSKGALQISIRRVPSLHACRGSQILQVIWPASCRFFPWRLKTPWPMAAWWTGGTSWLKKKWLIKSDTATLEQLARNCVFEQREVTQIWAARGKRTFAIKIRMAPTNSKSYARAVLLPCTQPPGSAEGVRADSSRPTESFWRVFIFVRQTTCGPLATVFYNSRKSPRSSSVFHPDRFPSANFRDPSSTQAF